MQLTIRGGARLLAQATLIFAASISFAHAESGDYTFFQTLKNLVSPPKADNPVRPDQRVGAAPLLSNPASFDDNFSPGKYFGWQTIQLAPQTGAVCGNGSNYKFFVNRVPHTRNTLIYFEGGGACWDYDSCAGNLGLLGARNPNGIADDYMKLQNFGSSLASPFIFRLHPWSRIKTQDWNFVYVPYCTGDVFGGDKVAVYNDPKGQKPPLVWHHNGYRNSRAVVAWVKDNLQRPTQMFQTGCSAGGVGSMANYHHMRRDIAPTQGYLLNDSGPLFPTPANGNPVDYPSAPLHNQIRAAWGLDGSIFANFQAELAGFTSTNVGTVYKALANRWPNDRMGHTHFWDDLNFSRYSYFRYYDDIRLEPDQKKREAAQLARWHKDTARLYAELGSVSNFGAYLPRYRAVNESHCSTVVDFNNGDIQERGLEMKDFIMNVLEGSGKVMTASESDTQADYKKPFNLIYWLVDKLL